MIWVSIAAVVISACALGVSIWSFVRAGKVQRLMRRTRHVEALRPHFATVKDNLMKVASEELDLWQVRGVLAEALMRIEDRMAGIEPELLGLTERLRDCINRLLQMETANAEPDEVRPVALEGERLAKDCLARSAVIESEV